MWCAELGLFPGLILAVSINFLIPASGRRTNRTRMNDVARPAGGNAANIKQMIAIYNTNSAWTSRCGNISQYWRDLSRFDLGIPSLSTQFSVRDEILRRRPGQSVYWPSHHPSFLIGSAWRSVGWRTPVVCSTFRAPADELSAIPYYLLGLFAIYLLPWSPIFPRGA